MRLRLLLGLMALVPVLGHADYCAERAERALGELTGAGSATTLADEDRARGVLIRLCRDAQDAATAPAAQAAPAGQPESTRLFGVEIKEAPKDAAGYERARKVP